MRRFIVVIAATWMILGLACGGSGSGSRPDVVNDIASDAAPDASIDAADIAPADVGKDGPNLDPGMPGDSAGGDLPGEVFPRECTKDEDCEAKLGELPACRMAVCDPLSWRCAQKSRPDGAPCSDGNVCTEGDSCVDGVCEGGPNECDCTGDADCASKEDGDLCNGTLYCDRTVEPYKCQIDPDSVPLCEDDLKVPCQKRKCVSETGECLTYPVDDGKPCDDLNPCTTGDKCVDASCVGEATVLCNDENPCTTDACVFGQGCVFVPNVLPCEDGDPCTGGDTCGGGKCLAGSGDPCDDKNDCTKDSCTQAGGCTHEKLDATSCEDGSLCTEGDSCADGVCVPGLPPACDDANPCTDDGCDDATGCTRIDNASACDDGNLCTLDDVCSGGACSGESRVCKDDDACTTDACDPATGECRFEPSPEAACDDSDACTSDACDPLTGKCVHVASPCDDGKACTTDACDPLTGVCAFVPFEGPCDDGDLCTEGDLCVAGECVSGTPVECVAIDACHENACDPETGACAGKVKVCADDDGCTIDSCDPATGCANVPVDCDDKDPCTKDTCNPADGSCTHEAGVGGCDDGNACTVDDTCSADQVCAGIPRICDDGNPCTLDGCDPAKGCTKTAIEGECAPASCDALVHRTASACVDGACPPQVLTYCDDGNPCTDDACDPATGCASKDNQNLCMEPRCDGLVHRVAAFCAAGACPVPATVSCDDGNPCTDDACDNESGCVNTPSTRTCAVARCEGLVHYAASSCTPVGCPEQVATMCDDGNPCTDDTCDADAGCGHAFNNLPCGSARCDGTVFVAARSCFAGACPAEVPVPCDNKKFCDGVETCDPSEGCEAGAPPVCNDGVACTLDVCSATLNACVSTWDPQADEGPAGDPRCSNGKDDDCDGKSDMADPDCSFRIDTISPASGPAGIPVAVAIRGGGFENLSAIEEVRFGDTVATIASAGANTLFVVVPPRAPGRVSVTVKKARLAVTRADAYTAEGNAGTVNWGRLQWPDTAIEANEGQPVPTVYGRAYHPGITDAGGSHTLIRAEACLGPVSTYPWQSAAWQCHPASFNAQYGSDYEYMVKIDPAPGGRFDVYYRFSLDNGIEWLYADKNGNDTNQGPGHLNGCSSDQALRLTVWGIPDVGDVVLNEIFWMGSNAGGSDGPRDEWLELRNTTAKPFKIGSFSLDVSGGGAASSTLVLNGVGNTVNSEVLEAEWVFLIARFGDEAKTAFLSTPEVVAPGISLPNPGSTTPVTIVLKNGAGTVLDSAVITTDKTWCGENGADLGVGNDRSMERNDVPGIGTVGTNWHTAKTTCRPAGAWRGVAPDNGHNYGSPHYPNCLP